MRLPFRRDAAVMAAAVLALSCAAAGRAASNDGQVSLDVPYVPTPQVVVDKMLEIVAPTPNDIVYDLGSGDGRIVITAAKRYGSRGVGIDIDPARVADGKRNAQAAGVSDKVRFVQQDLFESDFREATIVTMYLLQSVNEQLRPRLFEQLRPGVRLVSHSFDMGDWEPDAVVKVDEGGYSATLYHWVIPANVAGTWELTFGSGDQARKARLDLEQKYQKVQGRAEVNGSEAALEEVKLVGDRIAFTLRDPSGGSPQALAFTGRVEGTRMTAARPDERGAGRSGAVSVSAPAGASPVAQWSATRVGG